MKSLGALAIAAIVFCLVFNVNGIRDSIQCTVNGIGQYNNPGYDPGCAPSVGGVIQQSSCSDQTIAAPVPYYQNQNGYSGQRFGQQVRQISAPFAQPFIAPRIWVAPVYRWNYAPFPHRVCVTQGFYRTVRATY